MQEEMILCQQPPLIPLPHYCHPQLIALQTGPDRPIAQPCRSSDCTLHLSLELLRSLQHSGKQEPMLNRGQQPYP